MEWWGIMHLLHMNVGKKPSSTSEVQVYHFHRVLSAPLEVCKKCYQSGEEGCGDAYALAPTQLSKNDQEKGTKE